MPAALTLHNIDDELYAAVRDYAAEAKTSLDTAGNRTGAVPSRFEDGVLRFEVCTRGPDGGRIYYEITRQP